MAGWVSGWLAGWLAGWMAGWLDGWVSGWLAGGPLGLIALAMAFPIDPLELLETTLR